MLKAVEQSTATSRKVIWKGAPFPKPVTLARPAGMHSLTADSAGTLRG
jgi:hypothetical protein